MELKWFVLYTKPRFERKISETLSRRKISNYFPLKRIISSSGITYKLNEELLFPSYIFLKTSLNEFTNLKKIPGVISLVYWLGNPVSITDNELKLLRQFLGEHVNIAIQKISPGKDIANLFADSDSVLHENKKSEQDKMRQIILPSLGYQLAGEAVTNNTRLLSKNFNKRPKLAGFKLLNSIVNFNNFI